MAFVLFWTATTGDAGTEPGLCSAHNMQPDMCLIDDGRRLTLSPPNRSMSTPLGTTSGAGTLNQSTVS